MKKILLLAASVASAVLLASGSAQSQTAEPEYQNYDFVDQMGVQKPEHVVVDSQDTVYVADSRKIYRFDPNGQLVEQWDADFSIRSIAVDSQGDVHAFGYTGSGTFDSRAPYVRQYAPDGALLTEWGARGTDDGQFSGDADIAIDSEDNVHVVDETSRVQKFTPDGTFISKWGARGYDNGELNYPEDLAIDSRNNVYVSDADRRVQKFTSDGTFLYNLGRFREADGLAVDARDNVYVTEFWYNSVHKFTPEGEFVAAWGSSGEGEGQFTWAEDVAADSRGYVYVADHFNDRVQKFEVVPDAVTPESVASILTRSGDFSNGTRRTNKDTFLYLGGSDQGSGTKDITYEATGVQEIPSTTVASQARIAINTEGKTTFTHSATDRAGNVGESEITTVILDKTPPTVTKTMPEAGAAKVPRGASVSATFSEAMNSSDLSRRAFRFYEVKSRDAVATTYSYDEETHKATLNPKEPLKAGVSYKVIVGTLKSFDLADNPLDQNGSVEGNQPKKWRFTVED